MWITPLQIEQTNDWMSTAIWLSVETAQLQPLTININSGIDIPAHLFLESVWDDVTIPVSDAVDAIVAMLQ
jgi:hypothetical protein